jgi:RNA 2',3'-cyclic 3'-phosphodiesterase
MIRAFLGLDPPEPVRAALTVQQFLLPLPRKSPPENLHLTLAFMGEVEEPLLEAAHEALQTLRPAPFELTLQGFGLFGGARPHTVWAGVTPSSPLNQLQARVEATLRRTGLSLEHRNFTPHITLGRFPALGFEAAARLERAIATTPFTAGPWEVQDMVLWQSHLTHSGPHYTELARYPFA